MSFTLTITEGKDAGQAFEFDQPEITIGRTADNDVVLYDAGVSRAHVKIRSASGGFLVEDLGSSNGTFVNGEPIRGQVKLQQGDAIGVGSVTFAFGLAGAAKDASTRIVAVRDRAVVDQPPVKGAAMVRSSGGGSPARRDRGPAALESTGPAVPAVRGRGGAAPARAPQPGPSLARPRTTGPVRSVRSAENVSASERARQKRQRGGGPLAWFQAQPAQRKAIIGTGGGLVVLVLVGVIAKVAIGGGPDLPQIFDYSKSVFPITEKVGKEVFGNGPNVNKPALDRVAFEWKFIETQKGLTLVTLSYANANVKKEDMVEIRLNDFPIGYVPPALTDWQTDNMLLLPRKYLKPNDTNRIVFDNLRNPPGNEQWEVAQIKLIVEQLPICEPVQCVSEAKGYFDVGRRKYENKLVGASNLYEAWASFRKARLYLEPVEPKPDLYDMTLQMIKDTEKELQDKCGKFRFTTIRYFSQQDFDSAKGVVEEMLLHFPEPDHPCNRQAMAFKEKLER